MGSRIVPVLLVAVAAWGCAAPGTVRPAAKPVARPDLVPLQRVGVRTPGQYCNLDPTSAHPKLIVSVKNQGAAGAPNSVTRVEFLPGGTRELATPPVPAGGAADLPAIAVPATCFNPSCQFRITVDATRVINETQHANNSVTGRCAG